MGQEETKEEKLFFCFVAYIYRDEDLERLDVGPLRIVQLSDCVSASILASATRQWS